MGAASQFQGMSMSTDAVLVQILLTRSEAQLLSEVLPSAKLQSKIAACDEAIDYLSGHPGAFARRHGPPQFEHAPPCCERAKMNVRERVGSGTLDTRP
jgi:hypothetical protein